MDTFKPGDIVVYEHTGHGNPKRNGALGVVTAANMPTDQYGAAVRVQWICTSIDVCTVYCYNLRKVGELADGTSI